MEDASATASEAQARKRPREGDAATSAAGELRRYPPYQPIAATLQTSRVEARVCLFAVVAEIGAAVQSNGTDFTVTLRIMDESRKARVSVTFFAKDLALLPRVKSTGDVISLHHVKIQRRHDFSVLFEKDRSSFALFDSKVSECSPYQASMRYHASKYDNERLKQLRAWLPNNPPGLKDLELQLRNLKSDSTFDLVCQVFHVCEYNGKWIFYVWDGTDTPAVELDCSSNAEASTLLEGPPLSREVLCKMPRVGTVMMIFSDTHMKSKVPHMQKNVHWARFLNITCKEEFGVWKGIFLASSGVRLLSQDDDRVVDRRKIIDSRNAKRIRCRPMASFPSNVAVLSDVGYEKDVGYSTLMESLTHDEVTHKLKTLVRVVAAYPFRASEVYSLLNDKDERCILLTLEDHTSRIHAFVPKKEWETFFDGSPTTEVFIKKMNKLLGVPELEGSEEVGPLTRNPPWIWCRLKSYYLDKNDCWCSRRYQIYGTTIRD